MDESRGFDGVDVETGLGRWAAAGEVLARRAPALLWRLLALAEATVSEVSASGDLTDPRC